jgi:hypothetical protein
MQIMAGPHKQVSQCVKSAVSGPGPTACAMRQVGGVPGYTGRQINVFFTVSRDPELKFGQLGLQRCKGYHRLAEKGGEIDGQARKQD